MQNCKSMDKQISLVTLNHVIREYNFVADYPTKLNHNCITGLHVFYSPPKGDKQLLLYDNIGSVIPN